MNIKINFKSNSGFSLMEVIVAITIIVVGMIAIMSLMTTNITTGSYDRQKIVAINLAQEGIELVKNIRDSNWADNKNWDQKIKNKSDYRMSYDWNDLKNGCNQFLKIDNNGFYNYDAGNDTVFKRCINTSDLADGGIQVKSKVTWTDRGKPHSVEITSHLYEWQD